MVMKINKLNCYMSGVFLTGYSLDKEYIHFVTILTFD